MPYDEYLKQSTVEKYKSIIKKFQQTGKHLNFDNIVSYVEGMSDTWKKTTLSAIIFFLRQNFPKSTKLIKKIANLIYKTNKHQIHHQKDNVLSKALSNNYLKWKHIRHAFHKILKHEKCDKQLLAALFVLQPPRRLLDYSGMKIIHRAPKDKKHNYLLMTGYGDHRKFVFIFNHYKTSGIYGTQIIEITDPLIKKLLLKNLRNDKIPILEKKANSLSKLLSRLFTKYTGKRISVDILRHSYLTYMQKKGILDDLKTRKDVVNKMGTSVNRSLQYVVRNEKHPHHRH
jgi:hypothetical protein